MLRGRQKILTAGASALLCSFQYAAVLMLCGQIACGKQQVHSSGARESAGRMELPGGRVALLNLLSPTCGIHIEMYHVGTSREVALQGVSRTVSGPHDFQGSQLEIGYHFQNQEGRGSGTVRKSLRADEWGAMWVLVVWPQTPRSCTPSAALVGGVDPIDHRGTFAVLNASETSIAVRQPGADVMSTVPAGQWRWVSFVGDGGAGSERAVGGTSSSGAVSGGQFRVGEASAGGFALEVVESRDRSTMKREVSP